MRRLMSRLLKRIGRQEGSNLRVGQVVNVGVEYEFVFANATLGKSPTTPLSQQLRPRELCRLTLKSMYNSLSTEKMC